MTNEYYIDRMKYLYYKLFLDCISETNLKKVFKCDKENVPFDLEADDEDGFYLIIDTNINSAFTKFIGNYIDEVKYASNGILTIESHEIVDNKYRIKFKETERSKTRFIRILEESLNYDNYKLLNCKIKSLLRNLTEDYRIVKNSFGIRYEFWHKCLMEKYLDEIISTIDGIIEITDVIFEGDNTVTILISESKLNKCDLNTLKQLIFASQSNSFTTMEKF